MEEDLGGESSSFLISSGLGEDGRLPEAESSSPSDVNALAASMILRSFSFVTGPFFPFVFVSSLFVFALSLLALLFLVAVSSAMIW